MMFGYGSNWAFWQVGMLWLGMIAFWALVIWAVWAMVAEANRRPSQPPVSTGGDARPILDERLARGEIDIEEYRALRDAISSDHPSTVASAK